MLIPVEIQCPCPVADPDWLMLPSNFNIMYFDGMLCQLFITVRISHLRQRLTVDFVTVKIGVMDVGL